MNLPTESKMCKNPATIAAGGNVPLPDPACRILTPGLTTTWFRRIT